MRKKLAPLLWLLVLFYVAPTGCAESKEDSTTPTEAAGDVVDDDSAVSKAALYRPFVARLNSQIRPALVERAARDDFQKGLERRLAAAVSVAEKRSRLPESKRPDLDLNYELTLQEFYKTRAFEPLFTKQGRLTDPANAIFAVIQEAPTHALNPADYWVEPLTALIEKSDAISTTLGSAPGLELNEREQLALAAYLELNAFDVAAPDAQTQVLEMLAAEGAENPVPRIRGAYDLYRNGQQQLLDVAVELEVRYGDAYLLYLRDMSLGNLNRLSPEEVAKYGDEVHPKKVSELVLARLTQALTDYSALRGAAAAEAFVRGFEPPLAQYALLKEAYAKYKAMVEAGGWTVVPPEDLKKGSRSPTVLALKERLKAENYFAGTMDNFYDEDLTDAVALYQETHQMEITGEVYPMFWSSLNILSVARMQELEVNLRRYREAHLVKSDKYVFINIPDFYAELWDKGARTMRFKIVVGNTKQVCDPTTRQWKFVNATPTQHAKLEYLIFNPFWNVPARIERDEYATNIGSNASWLTENGFEYFSARDGSTVLRQLPGTENALGKVKFIFPNKYNTYMHDTPKKQFFEYPIRAFSHGCMRIEDPLVFAETLLEAEGKWDDKTIMAYLKERDETKIDLDHPIDVFIEYFTVRVDEFGRVHFLADIYKIIRSAVDTSNDLACETGARGAVVPAGADYGP